jgi:predicted nuclease of predicted toxin-antitoxin system
MKLLFDENISLKLAHILEDKFPGSTHPELINLRGDTDEVLWHYARDHDFIIVSKDNDFRQKAFLYGHPPKVIWLSVGNTGTKIIAELIRSNINRIQIFVASDDSLLVLELQEGA